MKIVEIFVEFIFGMIKRAVTLVVIGAVLLFAMWVFAVLMPEEAQSATELVGSFFGS